MDNEILLQTLLHELQDGVIVCDADAKITLFNQAAADFFGKARQLAMETLYIHTSSNLQLSMPWIFSNMSSRTRKMILKGLPAYSS